MRVKITNPHVLRAFNSLGLRAQGFLVKHDPRHYEGLLLRPYAITFEDRPGVFWYAEADFCFLDVL